MPRSGNSPPSSPTPSLTEKLEIPTTTSTTLSTSLVGKNCPNFAFDSSFMPMMCNSGNGNSVEVMTSSQDDQQKSPILIESPQVEQQKATTSKRGAVISMSLLAFILATSNVGTSLAAARLAKDITVNGRDLVSAHGPPMRVAATTSKSAVLQLDALDPPTDPERRRLHDRFLQDANPFACGPEAVVDSYSIPGHRWETGDTASIAGGDSSNADGGHPTVQCNAVGRLTYENAKLLYAQFCPWPQPIGANTPVGCDLGLAELLLVCGSRKTRILGGDALPTGGVPDLDGSGQYVVFPSPERDVPVGESMSLYFSALQLVEEPLPQLSSTVNLSPMTCEERFYFKLYCDPTNEQGCILISMLWNNQKRCQGSIQMCATSSGANISRRDLLRKTNGANGDNADAPKR